MNKIRITLQNGELACILVFMNVLTLLILLLSHYALTIGNRGAVGQVTVEQPQKLIQENSDVQSIGMYISINDSCFF